MDNKFWSKRAQNYDKDTEKNFADVNKKTINSLEKYCKSNMKVLDVGCGTCMFTAEIAKHVSQVDAIDYSRKMIEISKEKLISQRITNVSLKFYNIDDLYSLNNKYNMITAFNILLYVPNIEVTLNMIHELLDECGMFLSVTDCLGESNFLFKKSASLLGKINIIPKMYQFKVDELKGLIKKAGFEIVYGENFTSKIPNYFIAARKI